MSLFCSCCVTTGVLSISSNRYDPPCKSKPRLIFLLKKLSSNLKKFFLYHFGSFRPNSFCKWFRNIFCKKKKILGHQGLRGTLFSSTEQKYACFCICFAFVFPLFVHLLFPLCFLCCFLCVSIVFPFVFPLVVSFVLPFVFPFGFP